MTHRIKCVVSYDGSSFHGYQRQVNQRTVQGEIEKVLHKIHHMPITIHSAGRTDAHVHAIGQVFHFDTELTIENKNWQQAINSMLPADIYIKNVEIVEANDYVFHSRFSVKTKEYRYYLSLNQYNPLRRNYVCFVNRDLDINKMREALTYFEGTHDFTTFSSGNEKKDRVRTIYEARLVEKDKELEFIFRGNGFLRYQVRVMMGTLIEIGLGKKKITQLPEIFAAKNRSHAKFTAEPQGLYLYEVVY